MKDQKQYQQLIQEFEEQIDKFPIEDRKIILKAYRLAKKYHKGQIYDPDKPFIYHPVDVALILLNLGIKDINLICAAVLHDTVEDTELTYKDIAHLFGKKIAQLIKDLTRERPVNETVKHKIASKKKKFTQTMEKPYNVRLLKSADCLANLSRRTSIPKNHPSARKFPRWQKEAYQLYLPLAKKTNLKIYKVMKQKLRVFEDYLTK